MSKIASIGLTTCLALGLNVAAASVEDIYGVIDHGVAAPLSHARGIVACTLANGSKQLLVLPMDHRGGYELLAVDVITGESKEIPMPFDQQGDSPFASILSKGNKYYTHFGKHFVEYDPELGKFTFCHQTMPQMAMMMTEGPDGVIWSATYPNCGLVSYNPATKEFTDYGYLNKENWRQYPRHLEVGSDGWVYIGIGSTNGQIVGFNPKTKETVAFFTPDERPNPSSGKVFRTVDWRVYGKIDGGGFYEFKEGQRIKLEAPLKLDASTIKGNQGLFHKKFADGSEAVSLSTINHYFEIKDPDGTIRKMELKYTSDGCGTMSIAQPSDGNIYGGTWFPMRLFKLDTKTGEMSNFPINLQPNTIVARDNFLYIGAYSGGYVLRFDCNKPWLSVPEYTQQHLETNPAFYCMYKRECNRPHAIMVSPDGKTVLMGGTPAYGATGGGLVIVNPETGEHSAMVHTELAENEAVFSILMMEDNTTALIGTTTNAGTGGEVKAKNCSLLMVDYKAKKRLWSIKPFEENANTINFLFWLKDGTVLGVQNNSLFVFDVATKTVLRKQPLPESVGRVCGDQGPRLLFNYGDEILLALQKGIAKVDPAGPKVISLAPCPAGLSNGGVIHDKRFYMVSGSHIRSLNLDKPELFKPVE